MIIALLELMLHVLNTFFRVSCCCVEICTLRSRNQVDVDLRLQFGSNLITRVDFAFL